MPDDPRTSDLGRFAEPALLVLVSLSAGPKHGYAIMTDVESFSGAPLGPGTLYAVLARLERRGLIEPLGPEDRRRPYRLTTEGATALAAQLEEMGRFVRTARARQLDAAS
jgi:DNA-binding PadR family transcriptional regulator